MIFLDAGISKNNIVNNMNTVTQQHNPPNFCLSVFTFLKKKKRKFCTRKEGYPLFAKGHIRGYPLFKKWTLDIILTRGIPWEKGPDGTVTQSLVIAGKINLLRTKTK